jgi:Chromo (CHRromatin Organisation MOdifier) domain
VGFSSYKLKIPVGWKIHPVFNESLLRPVIDPRFPGQDLYDRPPPDIVDKEEEYEVDEVLDTHARKQDRYEERQFLVLWKGYPQEENTWQSKRLLANTPDVLAAFKSQHPALSRA